MGTATNGVLAYGLDLGGDDGWKIREVNAHGALNLPWFDSDSNVEFVDVAQRRLLAAHGFNEDQADAHYFEKKRRAEKAAGVTFRWYGSESCTSYALVTVYLTAYRGDCLPVTFAELDREVADGRHAEKLTNAVNAIGITPKQGRPQWMLYSWHG